jgi:hypothetical protein
LRVKDSENTKQFSIKNKHQTRDALFESNLLFYSEKLDQREVRQKQRGFWMMEDHPIKVNLVNRERINAWNLRRKRF